MAPWAKRAIVGPYSFQKCSLLTPRGETPNYLKYLKLRHGLSNGAVSKHETWRSHKLLETPCNALDINGVAVQRLSSKEDMGGRKLERLPQLKESVHVQARKANSVHATREDTKNKKTPAV